MREHQEISRGAVIISGASSGIGEACTIHLSKLGYKIFAGVRREIDAKELERKTLGKAIPIMLDITDKSLIDNAVDVVHSITEAKGFIGLVNNAGIAVAGPLELLPTSELRRQLEVNVIGQIALTQAFLPLLRKTTGRIINIGSDYGKVSCPLLGPYCASKFALEALTDSLRLELKPWKISVSLIEVGAVNTSIWGKTITETEEMWDSFPAAGKEFYFPILEAVKRAASKIKQSSLSPEAVARTVQCALSNRRPKARYVVGLDAKINVFLSKTIPDSVLDKLITLYLGLPGKI